MNQMSSEYSPLKQNNFLPSHQKQNIKQNITIYNYKWDIKKGNICTRWQYTGYINIPKFSFNVQKKKISII